VGIGYAGACRPVTAGLRVPRCKVDLKKWKTRREEWVLLQKQSLDPDDSHVEGPPRDPFQALKHGEAVAEALARKLAPRRIPKAGEVRRSFCFSGHRLLLRELNWLREARVFVGGALQGSQEVWRCPHRAVRWTVLVSQLSRRIQRSGFPRPPDLPSHMPTNLTGELREELMDWLTHAKTASEVRRAAIREDFAQARFLNVQNFRHQLMKSGGVLDQQVLQAALGKRQPRQRMWGLSGPAVLGVALELHVSRMEDALALLRHMSSASRVVRIAVRAGGCSPGQLSELQLWFRGPRQTGDFLVQWCTRIHDFGGVKLCPLFPPAHHVATDPDDMLAIQEWHMASEGLDTESGCPKCRSGNIQPITVTADNEPCGNPGRAVRYFCFNCNSVHDTVRLNPLPPCPLPLSVLQAMRSAPAGTPAQISISVDQTTLEACVRALGIGKSVGTA